MSRSHRTDLPNPASKFFEWSPKKGVLQHYNKETKENVTVKLPFGFMVLDELSMIGGGTKRNNVFEGFWSNSVKNLNTQELVVKSKAGIEARGLYAELKNRKGLKYVKSLYIAYKGDDDRLQIGHLKFSGSSLGAWFEFLKTHKDIYSGAFTIKTKSEPLDSENGQYYLPIFTHKADITPESEAQAQELDAALQEYLVRYFAQAGQEEAMGAAAGAGYTDGYTGPDTSLVPPDEVGGYEDQDDDSNIPF